MKKILYIAALSTAIAFGSCKNYLEFEPEGAIPEKDFFVTGEQAFQSVTAMYSFIRSWDMMGGMHYLIMSEVASDNTIKGSSPGDGDWGKEYTSFSFPKTQVQINSFWRGFYRQINMSNIVLDNIPDMPDNLFDSNPTTAAALKTRYVAEARFFRGISYFYLVRAFGGVPLTETPVTKENPDNILPRNTLEECYEFITKDLQFAADNLPTAALPSDELGRATSWAAKAFLAKVYLYLKDWPKVETLTGEIIGSTLYDLFPNFQMLFTPMNKFCEESIFTILSTRVPGNGDISNCQYAEIQGVRGAAEGMPGGWGWMVPSDNLAAAFDAAGDPVRKQATIYYRGDAIQWTDGPTIDIIGGETVMDGVSLPRYSGKAYVLSSIPTAGGYGRDQSPRLMRYAEVLLMNAEACIYTGGDAATPLNDVRDRVGLGAIGAPTIQDIYNERRLELACEQDRFWDLVRTGQAPAVLGPQGFKTGKNELYPIPQEQVNNSAGALTQNPGW